MVTRVSEFMDILWDFGPLVDDDGDVYYEAIALAEGVGRHGPAWIRRGDTPFP